MSYTRNRRQTVQLCTKSNKIAFESKADHPDPIFWSCDLDLDPVLLIYDLDLNIPNIHLNTKKTNVPGQGIRILWARTDRHKLFAPVTLNLTRWPSYTTLTCIFYTCVPKTNFLCQSFRKLSNNVHTDVHTDRCRRSYSATNQQPVTVFRVETDDEFACKSTRHLQDVTITPDAHHHRRNACCRCRVVPCVYPSRWQCH